QAEHGALRGILGGERCADPARCTRDEDLHGVFGAIARSARAILTRRSSTCTTRSVPPAMRAEVRNLPSTMKVGTARTPYDFRSSRAAATLAATSADA